ncbi:hypothetical protein FW774_12900 [Pedobacter sp. BS3]|uniref:heparinase II/III domain-containing protein n=1 Tax=Pedobacter sp. BS3 TaxID=2567937 RepID=UPI0011EF6919|nr:heparinase II/III family protein [Pedobacter sp. BS3]TZF83186.1 hypothetical protein FW774_12900 [Pedobacter sp. BS3]
MIDIPSKKQRIQRVVKYAFIIGVSLCCIRVNAQTAAVTQSYNYSKIAAHPRLLLSKGEEKDIKASIQRNPEFKKIDTYIMQVSDQLLSEPPLVYKKEGKRLLAVSRKALTRLYYLSYSYRMTGDKKYLDRAEQELNAVCAFENWNPSHFLDVGEMCMAVSIAYDWLYDDLKETTRKNVRKAIIEKAFAPSYDPKDANGQQAEIAAKYLHGNNDNWFLEAHNNWNSVCNAGLAVGALAILEDDKQESIAIIERTLKSNQLALKSYAPNGNYPEGPGYWNYGTSFQVMLIAALESALGSDNGLSKSPGFMESANYMTFAAGISGKYFNYYDCGSSAEPSSSMFWFANKMHDPSLVFLEIPMIDKGAYTRHDASDAERFLPGTLVFGKDLTLSKTQSPTKKVFTGKGITPVCIVRTSWKAGEGQYFGIKGGMAGDPHGHMDAGTFVYDTGNLRWAMDFGMQSYSTLESKGVDLWNMDQNSQRWDIFRYNNLNHNTLTINNQRYNVKGKAEIIETFDSKKETGAKVDLKPVLNLADELKTATRKAVIVEDAYLKIEDFIETNAKPVDLRWNMVTPASAEIVDKNTIRLSQQGKTMLLKFNSDIPFKLVIRPSENPKEYKCEYGNYKYGDYNLPNKGTVMVGFDAKIPANKAGKFTVTFAEGKQELLLNKNTFILDAPNPSSASEGDQVFHDISPIGISSSGVLFPLENPDWIPYGETTIKKLLDKSFKFRIDAKRITPTGLADAGIDRSADGQLGVRGGESSGIDKNEGYILGLDLTGLDPSVQFGLTKVAFTFLDAEESCTLVNRQVPGKMMIYKGSDKKVTQEVKMTSNNSRQFVDVSSLGISLKGGKNYTEILSLFNTSAGGSFRIAGFELVAK